MTPKKVNNALYRTTIDIGASRARQFLWYLVNIIFFKNPFNILSSTKVSLLKAFGAKVGKGVLIKPSVNIKYPWKLIIGNDCWLGEEVWIDNLSMVTMGNSVTLSQGAMLLTGSHDHTKEKFDFLSYPIVGINSVAEKKMEPYIIYKGNPAIPVLERTIL